MTPTPTLTPLPFPAVDAAWVQAQKTIQAWNSLGPLTTVIQSVILIVLLFIMLHFADRIRKEFPLLIKEIREVWGLLIKKVRQ